MEAPGRSIFPIAVPVVSRIPIHFTLQLEFATPIHANIAHHLTILCAPTDFEQARVVAHTIGNPIMLFGMSASFAGRLLKLCLNLGIDVGQTTIANTWPREGGHLRKVGRPSSRRRHRIDRYVRRRDSTEQAACSAVQS
jgi:hypothetical protein